MGGRYTGTWSAIMRIKEIYFPFRAQRAQRWHPRPAEALDSSTELWTMPTSNHQRQERRAAARRASVATDDVPDAVPRPQGRGPRNHFWDPRPPGVWRHNESNRTSAERRVSRAPAAATPPPSAADGGRESTRRGATRPSPSRSRQQRLVAWAARPFETARGAVRETSPAGMTHYITRRSLSIR